MVFVSGCSCGGLGAVVATTWIEETVRTPRRRQLLEVAVGLALFLIAAGGAFTRDPKSNAILLSAVRVREQIITHPGRYAMGDRAGLTGFLAPNGLLHLEGLVSPPALLNMVRAEAPLQDAFERFGIVIT